MIKAGIFAAVQMDSAVGDFKENTQNIVRLIMKVKQQEPETMFLVFPEMVLYGYGELEKIKEHTQEEINDCLKEIAKVCKEEQVCAVVGAPYIGISQKEKLESQVDERFDGKKQKNPSVIEEDQIGKDIGITQHDRIENALYLVTEGGEVQKIYAKMHLIESEREKFTPGEHYCICELPFGRVGFLICWDAGFAESARLYAKENIDLLVVSAAWEKPYGRQWELAVCGRAFDNSIPVIASNRIGREGGVSFAGHTMIIDSLGNIKAHCQEEEDFVTASIDFDLENKQRRKFGSQIEELREDTYHTKHVKLIRVSRDTYFKKALRVTQSDC